MHWPELVAQGRIAELVAYLCLFMFLFWRMSDQWREDGRITPHVVRLMLLTTIVAMALLSKAFWGARWWLAANDFSEASRWYRDHAHWVMPLQFVTTLCAAGIGATLLWRTSKPLGAVTATLTLAAVWLAAHSLA